VQEPPKGFPPLTLNTQRALCALEISSPQSIPTALDALYASFWRHGNHLIGKPEGFGPVLEEALGKGVAKDLLERMSGKEAKGRLRENTDKAMNLGAFGIPWYECENKKAERECFWGFDHLGQVVRFLDLDGSVEVDEGFKEGMRSML
jgi:2-hydroxychromene-2-carboxylate isomerase